MPNIPARVDFRGTNVEILNGLRDSMSYTWQERIPVATQDNMRDIANPVLTYEALSNEFINALVNRIALVLVTSKTFYNPLSAFKRGTLQFGETVEEIFVNIAKTHNFDPETAEKEVFNRELPDVMSAFHRINAKNFYKVTVSNEEIRLAFLSEYGISDLIGRIVESLYNGAQYDEFLQMKQLVAEAYAKGQVYPVHVDPLTEANATTFARKIKSISDTMVLPSTLYNPMGVLNYSNKRDQVLLITANANAYMDVDVLASAFNMDKVEFMGRRVVVDTLGDPSIVAALVDRDFYMVFNSFEGFTENYNGQGLYWNYFYHVWRIYSRSPFANAIVFTTEMPSVTVSGTLSPHSVNGVTGGSMTITNTTTAVGGASTGVTWELTEEAKEANFTLNANGVIGIPAGTTPNAMMPIVILTSTYDPTKTVTLAGAIEGN